MFYLTGFFLLHFVAASSSISHGVGVTEEQRMEAIGSSVQLHLQDQISLLRRSFHSNLHDIREFFYKSTVTCESQTKFLLQQTYGPFFEENGDALNHFFLRLQSFTSPFSSDSAWSLVEDLFKQLFRAAFVSLNPMLEVSEKQWECMEGQLEEVVPFGGIPKALENYMERSLTSWRNFTRVLDRTYQVLEDFMQAPFSTACLQKLATLGPAPASCSCSTALRDCLEDWTAMDKQWSQIIENLLSLSDTLNGPATLSAALGPLPVQLSEALMSFQEKGPAVTNKLLTSCFYGKRRSPRTRRSAPQGPRPLREIGSYQGQDELLRKVSDKLSSMKHWFWDLPQSLCTDQHSSGLDCDYGSLDRKRTERALGDPGSLDKQRLQLALLSVQLDSLLQNRAPHLSYDDEEEDNIFIEAAEPSPATVVQSSFNLNVISVLVLLLFALL